MKRHLVSLAAATFLAIPSATPHGGIRYRLDGQRSPASSLTRVRSS